MIDIETHCVINDLPLLDSMIEDANKVSQIYQPGKYWASKAQNAVKEIRKYGVTSFRGYGSVGTSYSDNAYVDCRDMFDYGKTRVITYVLRNIFPFKNIFDAQTDLTKSYYDQMVSLRGKVTLHGRQLSDLLAKYVMPFSVGAGCVDAFDYEGGRISNHYVQLMDTHDKVSRHVDFRNARSFFEIGGGFGVNIHILVENYKNLRKFIYLDIVPNLYVGTQYLKSFYGSAIRDYRSTRELRTISFSESDELEIVCIAPWQIQKLSARIDIFYNAHSFVEMSRDIVRNYISFIEKLSGNETLQIALISYDDFNLSTTIHPDELPNFFRRPLEKFQHEQFLDTARSNYYYVGKM